MRQFILRKALLLSLAALLMFVFLDQSASAQAPTEDQSNLPKKVQELFQKAKTAKEVEGIKLWCKDMVATFSFRQRDGLMVQALALMKLGKIDEANTLLRQVNSLKDLDENLGNVICRPN
jgi:hypothetical protein